MNPGQGPIWLFCLPVLNFKYFVFVPLLRSTCHTAHEVFLVYPHSLVPMTQNIVGDFQHPIFISHLPSTPPALYVVLVSTVDLCSWWTLYKGKINTMGTNLFA